VKRHELWRQDYRGRRDLDHLGPKRLSERYADIINNLTVLDERKKISVGRIEDPEVLAWMILSTEVLEECALRKYSYPGPISIAEYRDRLTDLSTPVLDVDEVLTRRSLAGKPYLLKFGQHQWLKPTLEVGSFRVSPASFYDRPELNHATRDKELVRTMIPNPRDSRVRAFLDSRKVKVPDGKRPDTIAIQSLTDYYMASFSNVYGRRLFGDFRANACLVIFDPKMFLDRLIEALRPRLPGWRCWVAPVKYFDVVRGDPAEIQSDLAFFKPLCHAYQKEVRLVCLPPEPGMNLETIDLELGCLDDCAELVDATSHPEVILPPDPDDAPIVKYGNIKEDGPVNQLPLVGKIQGMKIDRQAQHHEDWLFEIQYTDPKGEWHALNVPLLDGLYLLNMLRVAEKRQGLGLFNRE
jgi:hypothetical protein